MSGEAEYLAAEIRYLRAGGLRGYKSKRACPVCGKNISAENCKPLRVRYGPEANEGGEIKTYADEKDS